MHRRTVTRISISSHMSFNGKNYTKNYLEHFELLKGGVLDIKMGDEPNMNRGVSPEDFPYSFSVNEKQKK